MLASPNAIVPMACIVAAAIAAMVAEAFREPGETMPIGPLGIIGLAGASIATIALWNHNTTSFGVVSADKFGLFVTAILIVIGVLSLAVSAPVHHHAGLREREREKHADGVQGDQRVHPAPETNEHRGRDHGKGDDPVTER